MRHSESVTQCSCVAWFRLAYPKIANLLFAIPNGGARTKVGGGVLKKEGVTAGVSDLILLVPSGRHHCLCIEMKAMNGKQADTQVKWQKSVEAQGGKYIICRSVDEFINEINDYLNEYNTN